jgi:hypothetical protein
MDRSVAVHMNRLQPTHQWRSHLLFEDVQMEETNQGALS